VGTHAVFDRRLLFVCLIQGLFFLISFLSIEQHIYSASQPASQPAMNCSNQQTALICVQGDGNMFGAICLLLLVSGVWPCSNQQTALICVQGDGNMFSAICLLLLVSGAWLTDYPTEQLIVCFFFCLLLLIRHYHALLPAAAAVDACKQKQLYVYVCSHHHHQFGSNSLDQICHIVLSSFLLSDDKLCEIFRFFLFSPVFFGSKRRTSTANDHGVVRRGRPLFREN
jgi:hypothetical protein